MRNLIICCDGTWNTPDQTSGGVPTPTNVVRFHNALSEATAGPDPVLQIPYYHPGVGTDGNWWNKFAGGTMGVGLSKNIMSAYRWLGGVFRPGDRIFLLGFSRGAYTVRSLAGMICHCGLLDLKGIPDKEIWRRVEKAYKTGYRKRKKKSDWARDGWGFHKARPGGGVVKIHFLGVWDTVGALGVPNDMAILNLLDSHKKYAFHNTNISKRIENARHAVAMDEMRASFTPALWSNVAGEDWVKQVWFPGVHCDVGGGYPEKGLSDGALKWMMDEAVALGLAFRPQTSAQVQPDGRGVLHDSRSGLFKLLRSRPRSVPPVDAGNPDPVLHPSVLQRQDDPPIEQAPYRPTVRLAAPGDSRTLSVYASNPWNDTGLYLEAGVQYEFKAEGEWLDRDIACGPSGANDDVFQLGELFHLAGSLWGKLEGLFRKVTRNEEADFRGSKRFESHDWFALLGVVANGRGVTTGGSAAPHELVPILDGCLHRPKKPGYLHCFANDAWHFYDNNRGSVSLTVTRKS